MWSDDPVRVPFQFCGRSLWKQWLVLREELGRGFEGDKEVGRCCERKG